MHLLIPSVKREGKTQHNLWWKNKVSGYSHVHMGVLSRHSSVSFARVVWKLCKVKDDREHFLGC